jgi:molybdenum-dependent DNA-binding transcriptional regulator ModE
MARRPNHITCPHCSQEVPIPKSGKALGRKPLGIDVRNILDALENCGDIAVAAKSLGCSRAYIYLRLKERGTTPKEVIQEK